MKENVPYISYQSFLFYDYCIFSKLTSPSSCKPTHIVRFVPIVKDQQNVFLAILFCELSKCNKSQVQVETAGLAN